MPFCCFAFIPLGSNTSSLAAPSLGPRTRRCVAFCCVGRGAPLPCVMGHVGFCRPQVGAEHVIRGSTGAAAKSCLQRGGQSVLWRLRRATPIASWSLWIARGSFVLPCVFLSHPLASQLHNLEPGVAVVKVLFRDHSMPTSCSQATMWSLVGGVLATKFFQVSCAWSNSGCVC